MLLASALVLFITCASDQRAIYPHDPVFGLSLPVFFRVLAAVELVVAWLCLFWKKPVPVACLVAWLTLNVLLYYIGMAYCGVTGGLNGYIGSIGDTFGLSGGMVSGLLKFVVIYELGASLLGLTWCGWVRRQNRLYPTEKMHCWSCGIHIQFLVKDLGRILPCPNCRQAITLLKPEMMKMSCLLCQGHVEYPSHAIGRKISCPHCKRAITLKEPA
jgi:predicted RNA-binding Zn-ribbon protein involved in translation (DUF1610 family)